MREHFLCAPIYHVMFIDTKNEAGCQSKRFQSEQSCNEHCYDANNGSNNKNNGIKKSGLCECEKPSNCLQVLIEV